MPWTPGKLTEEVLRLKNAVPLTFNWYTGRTQPPVEQTQIVFWEDIDNDIAKILMRRGGKTYIFTSYLQPAGGGPTISVANHAHRHATSGSSLVDVGADPIAPYNFAWTGIHTWAPVTNSTPVTISKTASITSSDMIRVNDTDGSYFFVVDITGLVGINADPDAMLTIQGIAALSPPIANPAAWYYAESLIVSGVEPTSGSTVSAWTDSSGNGHNLTGGAIKSTGAAGTTLPAYYRAGNSFATTNLPCVDFSANTSPDNIGYFQMASTLNVTITNGFTIAMIVRDHSTFATNPPRFLGVDSADDQDNYISALGHGSNQTTWETGEGATSRFFGINYSHTDGNDTEAVVLRAEAGTGVCREWIDGVQITAHGTNILSNDRFWRFIGRHTVAGSSAGCYNCSVAEIIIYDRALTDPEVATVNTYLLSRIAGTTVVAGAYDMIRMKDGSSGLTVSRFDEQGWLGIGVDPTFPLDVLKTNSPQVQFGYDGSSYMTIATGATTGVTTFDAVGSTPGFVFADPVTANTTQLNKSYIDLRTIATPASPTAGDVRLYAKTGAFSVANLWLKWSDGSDFEVLTTGFFDTPSALVSLSAVTGSALTVQRSDSAPALDQSIAPTWTSAHIFNAATTFNALTTHWGGIDMVTSGTSPNPNFSGSVGDGAGNWEFGFKSNTTWSSNSDRGFFRVLDVSNNMQFAVAANGQVAVANQGGFSSAMLQVAAAAVTFPTVVSVGCNFLGKWGATTGASIGGVANAVAAAQFEAADNSACTATGYLGGYFAGMNLPANHAHSVIAGAVFRPWDGNLTNNANAHGSIYGAWIRQAGGSLGTSNTATNAFGLKIENILTNSKPTLSNAQSGLDIDEQVNTVATINKYGIRLANATDGYKAISIRDADVWIGSNASGELSLNGSTFNVVFYENDPVSYDDDMVTY